METDSASLSWGALVRYSNAIAQANISGCIALLDQDAGPGSCAVAVQARDRCRHDSCAATCPNGSTSTGVAAFDQCESEAVKTVCAQYAVMAQCDQAVSYGPCLFADFQAYFLGLGRIFCEAGMDAGGADGAMDAPGD